MRKTYLSLMALILSLPLYSVSSAATYEVPGFEEGAGLYDMKFRIRARDEGFRAQYDLPLDLTGVKNEIDVKGNVNADGILLMEGPHATLTCILTEKMCHAEYRDIVVDLEKVQSRLQAQGLGEAEIQSRLLVSDRFGGEPIGVIHFDDTGLFRRR